MLSLSHGYSLTRTNMTKITVNVDIQTGYIVSLHSILGRPILKGKAGIIIRTFMLTINHLITSPCGHFIYPLHNLGKEGTVIML